jgi:Zn-finger nucleic acid-binding protein
MSESALDKRRKALEESYFEMKNREALELLAREVIKKDKLCPVSREPLKESVMHGVVVYSSEKTGGVWIEGPELERLFRGAADDDAVAAGVKWDLAFFDELTKRAKEDIPHGALRIEKELQENRLSPATGEQMEKFEIDGIVLDRCEKSGGIWFDADELEQIIEKARTSGEDDVTVPSWVRSFFKAIGYN